VHIYIVRANVTFWQGQTIAQRWIWNNTIGPLTERPGRLGDWGYINTEYVPYTCNCRFDDSHLFFISIAVWDYWTTFFS
jgi:hypothetical protein